MPELNAEEISSMRRATPEEIQRSRKSKVFAIEQGRRREVSREVFERRAGRPRKPSELKERNHVVRFSDQFLALLKIRAKKAGYPAWQTYLKAIVADEIGFDEATG